MMLIIHFIIRQEASPSVYIYFLSNAMFKKYEPYMPSLFYRY